MEEVFVLSIGLIVGWSMKVIMSDSEVRRLRRENRDLEEDNVDLRGDIKLWDRLHRKSVEDRLRLKRALNKMDNDKYMNKLNKINKI